MNLFKAFSFISWIPAFAGMTAFSSVLGGKGTLNLEKAYARLANLFNLHSAPTAVMPAKAGTHAKNKWRSHHLAHA